MFASYIINWVVLVRTLIDIPKGLKTLEVDCQNLRKVKRFEVHQSRYSQKYLKLLLWCVLFLGIGILTCLLDGLSDTENYLLIPALVAAFFMLIFEIFIFVFNLMCEKKYHIMMMDPRKEWAMHRGIRSGLTALCAFIGMIFAFHSAMVVYTFLLIIFQ